MNYGSFSYGSASYGGGVAFVIPVDYTKTLTESKVILDI